MPRWNDGLVNAFPVPEDEKSSLKKLKLQKKLSQDTFKNGQIGSAFFGLPAELRNRVYDLVLFSRPGYRLADGARRGSRLALLLVCKRFHKEASYTLYNTYKFLVFPLQEFTPLPTIQELPIHYRILVTKLEMKLGSSWTAPPRTWRMTGNLQRCLKRLKNLQTLAVFIEFDPSLPVFKVKRDVYESYIEFCAKLVNDVVSVMPQVKYLELDGNASVNVNGLLATSIRCKAAAYGKILKWGRNAGWAHEDVRIA